MRAYSLLLVGLLVVGKLQAHEVVWWEDPDGTLPGNPVDFYYPEEEFDVVGVVPGFDGFLGPIPLFEPCIVQVNLSPVNSTLVSAQISGANPANEVDIFIRVLRAPVGGQETATVSGEWHATGEPAGNNCTAVMPNQFTVPITVLGPPPDWKWMLLPNQQLKLDAGFHCALQWSSSLSGPWLNIGEGQTFTLSTEMPSGFFNRTKHLGGIVSGSVTGPSGSPLSGVTLGLAYGGPSTTTAGDGTFAFPRLPYGMNLIAISNLIGASLNIAVPATNNTAVGFKVAMEAAIAPVTNAPPPCNCTPWCAIGFGTLAGGQTPVYYSGGANPPSSGAANCGQAQVTVTPPSGASFAIQPGTNHHQNSGPNPASGTWTVTTTVCGITKTCSVTVP